MIALTLFACGYELVAADAEIRVSPSVGSEGAFVDIAVPMRLETYGPSFEGGGFTATPFHGFIQTPVEADVACMGDVVLDAAVRVDQIALFFTDGVNDFEGMSFGADFLDGGRSGRDRGRAEAVLDFTFPCLPDPIPHDVEWTWEVDRTAPVPYDG